uniref:STAS domain-containing protein n=1 Tax=Trichuris muris TaxID=70415 RepID=A0A5S6Q8L3_TRIMR
MASEEEQRLIVDRPVYNLESLDAEFQVQHVDLTVRGSAQRHLRKILYNPSAFAKRFLLARLPCIEWLSNYKWKSDLVPDVVSGLTVGIVNISQGMAYGMLCGIPPIYGLYTSLYPPLFYAIFGSSRHMSLGTFSVISLMCFSTVQRMAAGPCTMVASVTNASTTASGAECWFCGDELRSCRPDPTLAVEVSLTLTFLTGILQILLGILNMGFLSVYLSDQMVEGLTSGSAILVLTSQVPPLFGISDLPSIGQPFAIVKFYGCFFLRILKTNWLTFLVSVVCVFVLSVAKERVSPLWQRYLKFPLPIDIIIVIIFTSISFTVDFPRNYGVSIVGDIPAGLLYPRLPKWSILKEMISDALSIGVVAYSLCVALGKVFAKKYAYRLMPNQEWYALGLANTLSSFFSCHPTSIALSRCLLQASQGGKTQVASVVAALVVMFVLLFLAPYLTYLPKCVLAATIVVALKGMFVQLGHLPALWKCSKPDFLIWVVSFSSVILLDMTYGLAVSVAFTLLTVIFKFQWAYSVSLGQLDESEIYQGVSSYAAAKEIRGIKIYRFDSPLLFANVELFKEGVVKCAGIDPMDVINTKAQNDITTDSAIVLDVSEEGMSNSLKKATPKDSLPHSVIIDCSSFSCIDVMGAEAMKELFLDYQRIHVDVAFASCKVSVRQLLERAGVFQHKRTEKQMIKLVQRRIIVFVYNGLNSALYTKRMPFSRLPGTLP